MASSNISTNARWDQWTGMTLVALVAYYVSLYTAPFVGDDASSVVAGFAVSVSGENVHERLSSGACSLGVILTVEQLSSVPWTAEISVFVFVVISGQICPLSWASRLAVSHSTCPFHPFLPRHIILPLLQAVPPRHEDLGHPNAGARGPGGQGSGQDSGGRRPFRHQLCV